MARRDCISCAQGAQITLRDDARDMPTGTPVHVICSYGDYCTVCHRRIQDGEHYWDPVRAGRQRCNACWTRPPIDIATASEPSGSAVEF